MAGCARAGWSGSLAWATKRATSAYQRSARVVVLFALYLCFLHVLFLCLWTTFRYRLVEIEYEYGAQYNTAACDDDGDV